MSKKVLVIFYCIYLLFFFYIWCTQVSSVFIYNKSPSVPIGWYVKQFLYSTISCDPLYVSINPVWIEKDFPMLAKSLIQSGTVILKYVNTHTRQYIIENAVLPQSIEVFAKSKKAVNSMLLGLVPSQYILGTYCRIF